MAESFLDKVKKLASKEQQGGVKVPTVVVADSKTLSANSTSGSM